MTDLDRECEVFCRLVAGCGPPPEVRDPIRAAYSRAHEVGSLSAAAQAAPFDRLLVSLAKTSPFLARLADSYCALFARTSLLRRKLVLLVAILESHAPTSRAIDAPRARSLAGFLLALPLRVFFFAIRAVLAAVLLGPLHAASLLAGRSR